MTSLTSSPDATHLSLPNIAIIGKAGAGKTSAAGVLQRLYNYRRISFAWPLKNIAMQLWGAGAAMDRGILQKLGVAVREIDPDTWVDHLMRRAENEDHVGHPLVCDDVRFENEYWRLRGAGWLMVRIEAPVEVRAARLQLSGKLTTLEQMSHVSETSLDEMKSDVTIWNGAPYELLDASMKSLVADLQRKVAV
jgi:cytidylate kinase